MGGCYLFEHYFVVFDAIATSILIELDTINREGCLWHIGQQYIVLQVVFIDFCKHVRMDEFDTVDVFDHLVVLDDVEEAVTKRPIGDVAEQQLSNTVLCQKVEG